MNIFSARINELYKLIERHAGLYYNKDAPEISDAEYDELVRELNQLENDYPELARKDFLTHKVGGNPSDLFAKVEHEVPMLSLDNVFAPDELANFFTRIKRSENFNFTKIIIFLNFSNFFFTISFFQTKYNSTLCYKIHFIYHILAFI